jgi:hypothetical protein
MLSVLVGVICFSDNGAAGKPGGGAAPRAPVPKAEPKEE